MREEGWNDDKPGVVVHEVEAGCGPRAYRKRGDVRCHILRYIAEEYKALREFFTEYVIGLLIRQGEIM